MRVVVELPGPVRGKGRPRFVRNTGHAFTDKLTVNYEAALRLAAVSAMAGRPPIAGPCSLVAIATFAVPTSWSQKRRRQALAGDIYPTTKPDSDNILKLTDALNGICFQDDKQVVSARITKRYAEAPGLLIDVEEIGGLALFADAAQ